MIATATSDPTGLSQLARALDLVSPLSDEEIRAFHELPTDVRYFEQGRRLIEPQTVCDSCFLLVSAFAHKRKFIGASNRVTAINLPGELVNVESALALNSDYAAEVFRSGDVAVVAAAELRELIFNHPGIARAFWSWTHREAAIYRQWLVNDEQRPLKSRIAHLLCETVDRLQPIEPDSLVPLTSSEVAHALGSITPYVGNELARLQSDGMVETRSDGLVVQDLAKLRLVAEYDRSFLLSGRAAQ